MSALFAFRNLVQIGAVSTANGTTVAAGRLVDLSARQLARGVSLAGGNAGGKWLDVSVPMPLWQIPPSTPDEIYVSRYGVRVIALLGLELPIFANVPGDNGEIEVFGWRLDSSGTEYYTSLGFLPAYRDLAIEGDTGGCHRILCLPAAGDGASYAAYRFRMNLIANGSPIRVKLGGIWISNAVELPLGVDADWSWGVHSAGTIAVSRGGQAFAQPAPALRTLRAHFSGKLDARLAFGKGITVPGTGIQRGSEWLSDAATHLANTGNCILIPRANDPEWVRRTAIYGRLNGQPLQIDHLAGDNYRATLEVIEER